MTLSINDTQHCSTLTLCLEFHVKYIVMLNVFMPSVSMLNVIMLNVVLLSDIMLNVIILSHYAECRYAE